MNIEKDIVSPQEVRCGLEAQRGHWQSVSTGAGVSHSWISQFMRGKISNPGYSTLRKLGDYLRKQKRPATKAEKEEA